MRRKAATWAGKQRWQGQHGAGAAASGRRGIETERRGGRTGEVLASHMLKNSYLGQRFKAIFGPGKYGPRPLGPRNSATALVIGLFRERAHEKAARALLVHLGIVGSRTKARGVQAGGQPSAPRGASIGARGPRARPRPQMSQHAVASPDVRTRRCGRAPLERRSRCE